MNKYRVSPPDQRRYAGRTYGSKAEMEYAVQLHGQREAGAIAEISEQPRLWLGVPENVYVPDFLVIPCEGHGFPYYVDVKGQETQKFKRDKKLWKSYGWLNLHVVKKSGQRFKTVEVINGGCGRRTGT